MIKIPLAKFANESFNAKPIAMAIVERETNKPSVDNSRTEAAINTTRTIITILKMETMNVSIAPSSLVLSKIFFNKNPINHATQIPATQIQSASKSLNPYSVI